MLRSICLKEPLFELKILQWRDSFEPLFKYRNGIVNICTALLQIDCKHLIVKSRKLLMCGGGNHRSETISWGSTILFAILMSR